MKTNILKSLLLALIATMLPQLASAYDFMVDGLCYNYNEDGTSVTLTFENTSNPGYSNLSGALNIPSSVTYNGSTYSVTSIDDGAFAFCTRLTSVTIPNSVTVIGEYAFCNCSALTSVTIPNSVTEIGPSAFSDCSGLTSIVIPNSVTKISIGAFVNCTGLTSMTIPNSVTSIGAGAFVNCTGLTSMTIPNSVTSIGARAFKDCSGLTSVTIPNSVTKIGEGTFSGCTGLTKVNINDIVAWCNIDFYNRTSNPLYYAKNLYLNGSIVIDLIIPNALTIIKENTFINCASLTKLTFHNKVTSILDDAFEGCTGLTTVTIPNSMKKIGYQAFRDCTGLATISIPVSVTSIGSSAFYGCNSLTSVTLTGQGASTLSILFSEIINQIKTVNIGSGITSLGNFGFTPDVVNCYAENPPVCVSSTFANYDGDLHVPTTSIASYFIADYWQNFSNIINNLSKVTLDKENADITLWDSLSLTAIVTPANDEVIWSSTNPSVASVDENGIVTAIGAGECDIYATLASSHDAAYAICHITVNYPEITLSLSDEILNMNIGDEQTLTAIITPDNTGLTPSWVSSDENVATVVNGKVTAIGEGECDIIATVLDQTATCHVTVTNNVTISLNIDNAILGASQILTVYPSCTPDVPVELVVTSSDPSVALARVVNRTKASSEGLTIFPKKDMALNIFEELATNGETKAPALASTKAIMIVGVQNGTATITVTTADGQATPAILSLRVVDVDGDRTITASDITCLYNHLLSGDDTYITTSDVNGDGNITAADITVLYNLLLGN